MVGHPGVDVGGPVAARPEEQLGRGPRAPLLREKPLVLRLVGDLRRDRLEDALTEPGQVARAELGGLRYQVRLCLVAKVGVEVLRESVRVPW